MSGVMIKVAIYALVRVLVDWVGLQPAWIGVVVLGLGALSAVGGVVYALFQHDLKRLLAALDREHRDHRARARRAACCCAAAAPRWAASRSPRRCCTRSTTPCSRRCCSSARARSRKRLARARPARRAAAAHAVDGRRVPRGRDGDRRAAAAERLPPSGHAAGAPPRSGLRRRRRRRRRRDRARRARLDRLAVLCFVKVVGLVLLGRPRRHRGEVAQERRLDAAGVVALAVACVVLGVAPGLLFGSLVGLAPWADDAPVHVGLPCPAPARCRPAESRSSSSP